MTTPERSFADAVIVAAGGSTRMGGADKMSELLLGRSLLQWSVEQMAAAQSVARVVVVTRPQRVAELKGLPWLANSTVVAGGERRSAVIRERALLRLPRFHHHGLLALAHHQPRRRLARLPHVLLAGHDHRHLAGGAGLGVERRP